MIVRYLAFNRQHLDFGGEKVLDLKRKANDKLVEVFGYEKFRPLQEKIIGEVLRKRDTLVIMPTGGGKSLCYQIPALIFDGLTIVVSPLISLMKDQVEQLRELGVPAFFLNSSLSPKEYSRVMKLVREGDAKLLYVAPETLMMTRTMRMLSNKKVDCLAIDEAHCISEWGHDFRPEYRQMAEARRIFSDAACIALTATATPRVQKDIANNLGFDSSAEFVASFNRKNLFLQVIPKQDEVEQTIDFLKNFPDQSGIIYCFSRKRVDDLAEDLADEGFSVRPYHAGLEDDVRKENQELFIRDDVQIIVATIAFGMGIDKPNVRFIVHYDLPKNIESYYQQIGRAGRDGLRSHCLLLFSHSDVRKISFFFKEKTGVQERVARMHLDKMVEFSEYGDCRRIPLLKYFGEDYESGECVMCDNCVEGGKDRVDITVPAQKFMSCVHRTGELYGAGHIIDILRGSKTKRVLEKGHDKLSTYGIGMEYSKKQWSYLSRQFLSAGVLEKDLQYGSLKITSKGRRVLKDRDTVMGYLEQKRAVYRKDADGKHDDELFQILRVERKRLADIADIPPYAVFPDQTLMEMATYFPQSKDSMSEVFGVGSVKLEKYSSIFIQIIREYCSEKGISEEPRHKRRRKVRKSKKRRHHEVGEAYNRGKSIDQLTQEYDVQKKTIVNHLRKYLFEGFPIRVNGLENLSELPQDVQMQVLISFSRLGAETLRPIYDDLDGEIDWDDLRILQLYYIAKNIAKLELDESAVDNEIRKSIREIIQNIGTIEGVNKRYSTYSPVDRYARRVARQILHADYDEVENSPMDESKYQQRLSEIKKEYPNAYEPWTKEDDELLAKEFRAGKSTKELCSIFKRHSGAIRSRLEKLELR